MQEAKRAISDSADYVGVGAGFTTMTKSDAGAPFGATVLEDIIAAVAGQIPVVALAPSMLPTPRSALRWTRGGVAVASAAVKADDPAKAPARIARQVVAAHTRMEISEREGDAVVE